MTFHLAIADLVHTARANHRLELVATPRLAATQTSSWSVVVDADSLPALPSTGLPEPSATHRAPGPVRGDVRRPGCPSRPWYACTRRLPDRGHHRIAALSIAAQLHRPMPPFEAWGRSARLCSRGALGRGWAGAQSRAYEIQSGARHGRGQLGARLPSDALPTTPALGAVLADLG